MVKLFSGTPGSGKSLHTAEKIYYALRAGRPVLANFEINLGFVQGKRQRRRKLKFVYLPNDRLTVAALTDFSQAYFKKHRVREDHILLVIDEAQLIFNAREWNQNGRSDWLRFFTEHRKYGYEIVLVAQFDRMLDRQIRAVIEYEYIHRKVSNFGVWGKIFSLVAFGKLFVAVQMWYPLHERIGAEWFVCRPRFFRLYDTFKDFRNADSAAPLSVSTVDRSVDGAHEDLIGGDLRAKFYEVS